MQGRCDKHLFESAEDTCGKCGYEFCGECLVYAFGPKKPPFCISCAVAAAGIRSSAGNRPLATRSEMRQIRKERRSAERQARKQQQPVPVPESEPDTSPLLPWDESAAATDVGPMPSMPGMAPILPAQY
jgi:hypothetical protein